MKAKKIGLTGLIITAICIYFFIFYDKDYQPSTDFDETESHLLVWSQEYKNTYTNFIKNLAEDDHVTLFVPKKIPKDSVIHMLTLHDVNIKNVQIESIVNDNIWIRDFGPVFLNNKSGKTKTVSFKYYQYAKNIFPYEYQSIVKERLIASRIVGIGGARELNGKGLAILVEKHEQEANSTLNKSKIANELKKKLGVKKIIWLKSGLPQDELQTTLPLFGEFFTNGAGHHIDSFCRFISANTVLLAQVSPHEIATNPIMKIANDRLEENYNILKEALDQDGKPLTIIRFPIAPLLLEDEMYFDGIRSVIHSNSYLNFIITKHKVIVPSYGHHIKTEEAILRDLEAENKFKSIFPNKKIVMLDCIDLNRIGGGFHCISINKPKIKKKTT